MGNCNYYVYDVEYKVCYLYETCDTMYDCPAYVIGDEKCWLELGQGGECSLSPTTTTECSLGAAGAACSADADSCSNNCSCVAACMCTA